MNSHYGKDNANSNALVVPMIKSQSNPPLNSYERTSPRLASQDQIDCAHPLVHKYSYIAFSV